MLLGGMTVSLSLRVNILVQAARSSSGLRLILQSRQPIAVLARQAALTRSSPSSPRLLT